MDEVIAVGDAAAQLARRIARAHPGGRIVIVAADCSTAALDATGRDPPPRGLGGWRGKGWADEDLDDPRPAEPSQAFTADPGSA